MDLDENHVKSEKCIILSNPRKLLSTGISELLFYFSSDEVHLYYLIFMLLYLKNKKKLHFQIELKEIIKQTDLSIHLVKYINVQYNIGSLKIIFDDLKDAVKRVYWYNFCNYTCEYLGIADSKFLINWDFRLHNNTYDLLKLSNKIQQQAKNKYSIDIRQNPVAFFSIWELLNDSKIMSCDSSKFTIPHLKAIKNPNIMSDKDTDYTEMCIKEFGVDDDIDFDKCNIKEIIAFLDRRHLNKQNEICDNAAVNSMLELIDKNDRMETNKRFFNNLTKTVTAQEITGESMKIDSNWEGIIGTYELTKIDDDATFASLNINCVKDKIFPHDEEFFEEIESISSTDSFIDEGNYSFEEEIDFDVKNPKNTSNHKMEKIDEWPETDSSVDLDPQVFKMEIERFARKPQTKRLSHLKSAQISNAAPLSDIPEFAKVDDQEHNKNPCENKRRTPEIIQEQIEQSLRNILIICKKYTATGQMQKQITEQIKKVSSDIKQCFIIFNEIFDSLCEELIYLSDDFNENYLIDRKDYENITSKTFGVNGEKSNDEYYSSNSDTDIEQQINFSENHFRFDISQEHEISPEVKMLNSKEFEKLLDEVNDFISVLKQSRQFAENNIKDNKFTVFSIPISTDLITVIKILKNNNKVVEVVSTDAEKIVEDGGLQPNNFEKQSSLEAQLKNLHKWVARHKDFVRTNETKPLKKLLEECHVRLLTVEAPKYYDTYSEDIL